MGYKCIDCGTPMGGRMGPHDTVTGYGQCAACQDKPPKPATVGLDLEALEAFMTNAVSHRPNMTDLQTAGQAWIVEIRRIRESKAGA